LIFSLFFSSSSNSFSLVFRPGRISGSSVTGALNPLDLVTLLLLGIIELKAFPKDLDKEIDLAPVDYISKAIVFISRQERALGKAFHLYNNQPSSFSQLMKCLVQYGHQLTELPLNQFLRELEKQKDNPFYLLRKYLSPGKLNQFGESNTREILSQSSITQPKITEEILMKYVAFLSENREAIRNR
jgi:thioester reductase-like protein